MIRYQWLQTVTPHSASTVCFGRNCPNFQALSKINSFVCYLSFWKWHRITVWLTTSWLWPNRLLCWENMYVILALFRLVWVGKLFLDCRWFQFKTCKNSRNNRHSLLILVALRSKAWVCGNSFARIADSSPTWDMDVCLLEGCVLSGRGLTVGLITRPEESYRL